MKRIYVVLVSLIGLQSFAAQSLSSGIYLLKDNSLNGYEAAEIGLQNLHLQETPVLNIKDFITYKCSDHSFELTSEAKRKIPEGQLKGLPFVFVAHNSKIYLGAFWTSFSSFSFGYPIIDTEWFKATGELKISRSYPHDGYAIGDDPRADSRIIDEMRNNQLLMDSCP